MSHALTNKYDLMRARAKMYQEVRAFFSAKGVLEVDVPSLSSGACIDRHIHLIEASVAGERAFLHSSPEYYMKRLLVEGVGDCYQMARVYRNGEVSNRHNPEFTMIEWYRLGFTLEEMIEETIALASLFVGKGSCTYFTYEGIISHFLGRTDLSQKEKEEFFAFTLDRYLEKEEFVIIQDFPESEAALAQLVNGVAKRFELFYHGMELANGYLELQDGSEYRDRLTFANQQRLQPYPPDEDFLQAMEKGLPSCSGVAVGFDRLMMCRYGASIQEVLPFPWEG